MTIKDSSTSIRKHANEWTAIKQDLSPDLNPLYGAFKKKCNFPSKYWTAVEEEWNKMSEEFTLKTCESFQRRVYTYIEKNCGHIE